MRHFRRHPALLQDFAHAAKMPHSGMERYRVSADALVGVRRTFRLIANAPTFHARKRE